MPDIPQNLIRSVANGAASQLRLLADHADREEARRIYADIKGIAEQIRRKHNFVKGGTHQDVLSRVRVG